jgi:hypothetical protein
MTTMKRAIPWVLISVVAQAGPRTEWPPSLRDPTPPLVASRAKEAAPPVATPGRWERPVPGFRHGSYDRFCEARARSSRLADDFATTDFRSHGGDRALTRCLTRR